MKKRKFRSFSRRLTRRLVLTLLIVMGIASLLVFYLGSVVFIDNEQRRHEAMLEAVAENVERVVSDVYVGAQNIVPQMEDNLARPDRMYELLQRMLEQNKRIRSCGISFVENYYPQKGRGFVPYAIRKDSTHIETANQAENNPNYWQEEWFVQGLQAKDGRWSEPFFESNDTTKSALVAYTYPIRNRRGQTVAVLGVDLSLGWLQEEMEKKDLAIFSREVHIGDHKTPQNIGLWKPYSFLISKKGTFIVHPDKHRIIRDNFSSMVKASADTAKVAALGRKMMAGEKGCSGKETDDDIAYELDIEGRACYLFYTPIKHAEWSLALAVPYLSIDLVAVTIGGVLAVLVLLAVLVVWLVSWLSIRRATKPLKQLALSADEVAKGNFEAPLPNIKHNDEISTLRNSFEGMQHSLKKYVSELQTTTASKAAIENELKVAHGIQMAMLPKIFPPYPERDDIDIFGSLTPAKDVGGDLFDFFIQDNKFSFCIGDVSGKGVPASLVMAVTRTLFRNVAAHTSQPGNIVAALNQAIAEGNDSNMFVTLFVGVLDLRSGQLCYSNAGHDAPMLVGQGVGLVPCDSNLPLGVMPEWQFSQQQLMIAPGTTIFLYTDGLNEAEDCHHEQFGMDRMRQVAEQQLAEGKHQPQSLVNKMTAAVHAFVGEAEQSDDLTMLAVAFVGNDRTT
ncbi:MAG: SpoIIE family protein phosphatase [Bacteroidaceae bacterium]|nr:SpoIIE family protein phosphatase [Bacteroidaceae bacterium]